MDTRTGKIQHLTQTEIEQFSEDDKKFKMFIDPTPKQFKQMKVGRNDLCPCGSGKKFKKCHLGREI